MKTAACPEYSGQAVFLKNATINISETKVKHYANKEMLSSYHQMKYKTTLSRRKVGIA